MPRISRHRRRARADASLLGLLLCLVAVAPGTADAADALPVEEVAPGLFVFAGEPALMTAQNEGAIANLAFVLGQDAVAVVDTGGSQREGERLLAAIRERTALPIRFVINTHVHPDHVFGNGAFLPAGAVFVGHRKLPRALAARGPFYLEAFRGLMSPELIDEVVLVPPSVLVEDTLELDLGGRVLRILAQPTAHTDHDLAVFDPATGTLLTGDLLFLEHLPVIDGSLKGWLSVMDRLAELPAERAVPGHGPASVPWPEALEGQRRYLERLLAELRRSVAEGATLAEAVTEQEAADPDGWLLFEEFHARNATAAFSELEWE